MASPQGSFGMVEVFDDFLSPDNDLTWGAGQILVGAFALTSVNEGTLEWTVDEPGGIVALTTDTADNDNAALYAGPFRPADGTITMEARFKVDSITTAAVFVGFSQTLAIDTPVMPAEFATATMTYNGTGGMVGLQFDPDGTVDDWRAVAGDGGAGTSESGTTGVRANDALVADEFQVAKVTIYSDGSAEVYLGHTGDLKLVKAFAAASVTPGDLQHAVLMVENRDGSANVLEVDYMYAAGSRDWTK